MTQAEKDEDQRLAINVRAAADALDAAIRDATAAGLQVTPTPKLKSALVGGPDRSISYWSVNIAVARVL